MPGPFVLFESNLIYTFLYRYCKANRTAYMTFKLNKVFNVDISSDYDKWPGLADALDGLKHKRVRVELDVNGPQPTSDALKPIAESTNLDFQKFRSLVRFIFTFTRIYTTYPFLLDNTFQFNAKMNKTIRNSGHYKHYDSYSFTY